MKPKRPRKLEKVENGAPVAPAEPVRDPWWAHIAVVLALLTANLALYHGALGLGFLSVDDPDYVQNNPYIERLSAANLKHILTVPYTANYAPANLLSYALDVALARGKSPFAIHLSNVLWHGWVACMVYLLAFTIRPRIGIAGAAAFLFLLHPAHVEVVAWISSRKDLVATGFAALAMTCYLLYRRRTRLWAWCYAGSLLSFLLASAGKQSALLLPAVMLAWDVLVEKRRNWRMFADKLPFGLIMLFFGWMTWHAQPSTNQALVPFVLAATEFTNLWLLTGLGQYTLYRGAPQPGAWSATVRLAVIAVAVLAWVMPLFFARARQTVRAALSYWVLIQMVPPMLLGFIVPITDRYLFLPSVAVCILLADIAAALAGTIPRARWLGWSLLAGLGIVWGAKTWNYVNEWRDPRSVWYGAHLKTRNSQVFQFLGEVYQNAGDRISNFVKSGVRLEVTNEVPLAQAVLGDAARVEQLQAEWTGAVPTRTNSIAYRDQLWDLAWAQFEESLARRGTLSTPNLFMCRGRLLVSRGKPGQAIPEFQKALAFAQNSSYQVTRYEGATHALFAIGVAYWNMGNYKEAQRWLLQAQAVQRKSGQPWLPALDREVERVKALAASQK
jgi:protein O-mannosyl-transferase